MIFAHGGRFGVLFGLLAVGLLIKNPDFVGVVGVRGASQPGRGAKLAHGFDESMCNFRIGEFAAYNRVQLRENRLPRASRSCLSCQRLSGFRSMESGLIPRWFRSQWYDGFV